MAAATTSYRPSPIRGRADGQIEFRSAPRRQRWRSTAGRCPTPACTFLHPAAVRSPKPAPLRGREGHENLPDRRAIGQAVLQIAKTPCWCRPAPSSKVRVPNGRRSQPAALVAAGQSRQIARRHRSTQPFAPRIVGSQVIAHSYSTHARASRAWICRRWSSSRASLRLTIFAAPKDDLL